MSSSPSKANAGTRWIGVASVACLVAALGLQLDGLESAQNRPPLLQRDYASRAQRLIDEGRIAEALIEVDTSSLINAESVALLLRMPAVDLFDTDIARDVALRRGIAQAWIEQLGASEYLNDAQREILEPATSNAEMLLRLAPLDARSWYVVGHAYLRRGFVSEAPIDYLKASRHLQRALELDPELPTAAAAFQLATARSKTN